MFFAIFLVSTRPSPYPDAVDDKGLLGLAQIDVCHRFKSINRENRKIESNTRVIQSLREATAHGKSVLKKWPMAEAALESIIYGIGYEMTPTEDELNGNRRGGKLRRALSLHSYRRRTTAEQEPNNNKNRSWRKFLSKILGNSFLAVSITRRRPVGGGRLLQGHFSKVDACPSFSLCTINCAA